MKLTRMLVLTVALWLVLAAEEPKKTEPPSASPIVVELQAELATLRAKHAQCQLEMALWQNIPVMETRLALARELVKEAEREAAMKKQKSPPSTATEPPK